MTNFFHRIKEKNTDTWHCDLNKEGSAYCAWHKNPHHKHYHALILAICMVFYGVVFYSFFNNVSAQDAPPTCEAPQVSVDNVCTDPAPAEVPVCVEPQVLVDNVCTDPAPVETPTCEASQVLVDNVCTDLVLEESTPLVGEAPPAEEVPLVEETLPAEEEIPAEVPVCVEPQVLVDNICTDPAPAEEAPPVGEAPPAEEVPLVEETLPAEEEIPAEVPVTTDSSPVITSISSPILKGTFHSGVVPIIIAFSEGVVVNGEPQLILSTGSPSTTAVPLKFAFGNQLYFLYHIISGNSASFLDYSSSSSLNLNGASIKDLTGNDADTTLPGPGSSGSLSGVSEITIETISDEI